MAGRYRSAIVRLLSLLKRRPGTTHHEFLHHWREVHGPLVADRLGRHLVSYEQLPALPGQEWDGAAVLTFASREAFDSFLSDPAYGAEVLPDEERFLDRGAVSWLLTAEPAVIL